MSASLAEKLLAAGTTLIAGGTGLPLAASRAVMETATYTAVREHGLERLPTPDDPLPLRHAIIERSTALVRSALIARGVSRATATQLCEEMRALYRAVRPMPDADSSHP